jgi:general stress protein YciG
MTEPKKQGFATMDPTRVRQIAVMGGRRSQESGRGHAFTSAEAREAGRKGGAARAAANRAKSA